MKKLAIAAAVIGTFLSASAFAQAEGPLMVRARAVHLDSANSDSTGLGLTVNNKWLPEVDISYFITPNIAAELILTVPQKHTLYSKGANIGSLRHLPPTLTVQYHFAPTGTVRPYVGAGLNYTHFSSIGITVPGVTIEKTSTGLAFQAGVDIAIAKNMYLNIDLKKVQIGTDVAAAGKVIGTFKVDPLLLGVGVGYRF